MYESDEVDYAAAAWGTASYSAKPDDITEIEPIVPDSVFLAFAVMPDPPDEAIDCGGEAGVEIVGVFRTLDGAKTAIVRHFRERRVAQYYARLLWFSDTDAWTARPEEREAVEGEWHAGAGWYGIRLVRVWP